MSKLANVIKYYYIGPIVEFLNPKTNVAQITTDELKREIKTRKAHS